MPNATDDLWPGEWGVIPSETPLSLLKSQASLLANKTNGVVEAAVVKSVLELPDGDQRFVAGLQLIAPMLGGYQYKLLRVVYPVAFFPCRIAAHDDGFQYHKVANMEELRSSLQNILTHEKTRQVVNSLIAQSSEGD